MKKRLRVFKRSKTSSKVSVNTDPQQIEELLSRGVNEVIDKEALRKRLLSGERLRIKLGIDPTSPNLHLGRSIPLLKLRDFQKLGHQVVFIIGDFTGVIGDTSDKESERPMLAREVLDQNMETYVQQAGKILDIDACEIHYNSEWLGGLTYGEIGEQADQFSLAEFIARENIKRRLDAGSRVSLRELLYPLMQGYDSVAIHADVELGGTDQRFNLLAGRALQKHFGQRPQDIVMNPLIEGTDGRKMSSSWGNTINLIDEPNDMFGKAMTIADDLVISYFINLTRTPLDEIERYKAAIDKGENPRDYKVALAKELVCFYHGEEAASSAEQHFISTFVNKDIPEEMPEVVLGKASNVVEVLLAANLVPSKSEARRVIDGGGVKVDGVVVTDYEFEIDPATSPVLQKGKRHFVRLVK